MDTWSEQVQTRNSGTQEFLTFTVLAFFVDRGAISATMVLYQLKRKFRMKIALIIVIVIALALGAVAFYFYNSGKRMKNDLTLELSRLKQQNAVLDRELKTKIGEISKEKEEEIDRLTSAYEELVADLQKEIADGQIQITQLADRLSVSMVDKILFPSGKAEITPEGLEVLERVGKILKSTKDKIIRVEGHTDNVGIHPNLQKIFPTNWELSTARATNVVRFLQEEIGIDGARLQAIGMSEYYRVASNRTESGRSQNRRIEIILLPESSEIEPEAKTNP
jgi:chemotaxis protein MotB